jgi:hypothetical protein
MAHKDNTKNAENEAKAASGDVGAVVEEVVEAPVVVKTGHHTGVVQLFPKVANPH